MIDDKFDFWVQIVSKLSLLQAYFLPDQLNPFLKLRKVVLESQFFVFYDANQFHELVVLLFLLANVLFAEL